ncbi:hypothetical protein EVAR_19567_1 [Eumeta japonica]|uniref:Uncharacterized protein n=1 Tax=Eumeta variegata TaxID=151549 RepID=A0A4C1UG42_EUMVA|nr:hypothetical protein EVAR_19567_1 [Eumeta japonica]
MMIFLASETISEIRNKNEVEWFFKILPENTLVANNTTLDMGCDLEKKPDIGVPQLSDEYNTFNVNVNTTEDLIEIEYGPPHLAHAWVTIPTASVIRQAKVVYRSSTLHDQDLLEHGVNHRLHALNKSVYFDIIAVGSVKAGEDTNLVLAINAYPKNIRNFKIAEASTANIFPKVQSDKIYVSVKGNKVGFVVSTQWRTAFKFESTPLKLQKTIDSMGGAAIVGLLRFLLGDELSAFFCPPVHGVSTWRGGGKFHCGDGASKTSLQLVRGARVSA